MMRKLLSISILSLLPLTIWSQSGKSIPGYLGSRNALSLNIAPNVIPNDQFIQQLIDPTVSISYERATSRRNSFFLSIGTCTGSFNGDVPYNYLLNQHNKLYVKVNGTPTRIGLIDSLLLYNVKTISIGRCYYHLKSGSIAPQGKSLRLGLTYNIYKVLKDDLVYHTETGGITFMNPNNSYKSHGMLSFNMEFGSRRFITKHLFFRKSFSVNIPFNLWTAVRNQTFNNIEDFNETHLAFFISKVQTVNFSIGVGAAF